MSAGSHTIEADYSGDSTYAAVDGSYTQVVDKAPLYIVPNNLSRPVGRPNPPLTYQFTGFVNGDTAASADITGSADLTTTATANSPAGNYPITVTDAGTLTAANYDFPFVLFESGTLRVTPGVIVAVVSSTSQGTTYGQPVSFTFTASGAATIPQGTVQFLVNGTDFGSPLPLSNGNASSITTTSLDAGSYTIQAEYSGDSNYAANISTFTQVVNKATLTVIANNQSMVHSGALPTLTYVYAGFVNGDTAASAGISDSVSLTTTAGAASSAGDYAIQPTVNSFSSANYIVGSTEDGTLTIAPTVDQVQVTIGHKVESFSGLKRNQRSAKIKAIDVIFSDNVDVSSAMLQLLGVSASKSSFSSFSYNPGTFEATWTLRKPIAADRLSLSLSGEAASPMSGTGPPISASAFREAYSSAPVTSRAFRGRLVKVRTARMVVSTTLVARGARSGSALKNPIFFAP